MSQKWKAMQVSYLRKMWYRKLSIQEEVYDLWALWSERTMKKEFTGEEKDWKRIKLIVVGFLISMIVSTFFGVLAYGLDTLSFRIAFWLLLGELMLVIGIWIYKPYLSSKEADRAAEACGWFCMAFAVTFILMLAISVTSIFIIQELM